MSIKPHDTAEALEAQIAQLKADFARLAEQIVTQGKQQGATLSDAAHAEASKLRDKGAAGLSEAQAYVAAHPGAALGAAAGLGFFLGLILGRR